MSNFLSIFVVKYMIEQVKLCMRIQLAVETMVSQSDGFLRKQYLERE